MQPVHATAVIEGRVDLPDDVTIGPGCVIDGSLGRVTIGPGTRLIANVYLCGPLSLGAANTLYPGASLGFCPQSLNHDPSRPGCGLVVGDHNTFREGVTIHRAMGDDGPTTVGHHNYFMANSHAGHDTRISDHCTFANGMLLGGHVTINERVTIGGNTSVHQFCRIGRGAMLSGCVGTTYDLPAFFMLTGLNITGGVNVVGMRRQGMSTEEIEEVRWVYKTLYRRKLPPRLALQALKEREERPLVAEYIAFLESSKRGLCPCRGDPKRSLDGHSRPS